MKNKEELKFEIRARAEGDLETFIRLIHPNRVLGAIHSRLLRWITRADAKSHQLVLLPRDHQKSAMAAYLVTWLITKNPALRVLYISSTSNLAVKQLKFIKDILTSDTYRFYWPDMVTPEESKREKWTETEISVDHPRRKEEHVRDSTIFAAGLTTNIVGLHCDVSIFDDVVVDDTAYTEEGREKTQRQYSLLASIEGTEARQLAVGTRYHSLDLYHDMQEMEVDQYDENSEIIDTEPLYEIFEEQVEDRGDGTGNFLWPVQTRKDGRTFGFDERILARKRAQYLDSGKFRAQYYNDPHDIGGAKINRDMFQYYDKSHIRRQNGKWYYKSLRLNVFAAVDFAFSLAKKADYTSIAVVGMSADNQYFILDVDRFKTDSVKEYFKRILSLHRKWDFKRIKAEITSAQDVIVKALKEDYIRPYGLALTVIDEKPSRNDGNKEERIAAVLDHKYENRQMWHYQGGNCQILEDELTQKNPSHDDVKDAVAMCVAMCIPPSPSFGSSSFLSEPTKFRSEYVSNRFGGVG